MLLTSSDTQKIGRAGELLTQYKLLKFGVDTALLTTDSGIDLVAFAPGGKYPVTIQVKANLAPKKGGGKGKPALDWWVKRKPPVDLFAFVDLSSDNVWLFKYEEMDEIAQQKPDDLWMHFYMYTDPTVQTRTGKNSVSHQFASYLLENRVHELFY